jgi:tetratricopeptide (TPR) repeat protein
MLLLFVFFAAGALAAECLPPGPSSGDAAAKARELEAEAQKAIDGGRFAGAAQIYRQLVCIEPANARHSYVLGVTEAAAGNLAEARQALEKADQLRPESPLALPALLRVHIAGGDESSARRLLRDAGRRFPSEQPLHAELARLLAEAGWFDLALAEALRGAENTPSPSGLRLLAALELKAGAYRDAARDAAAIVSREDLPAGTRADAADLAGRAHELLDERDRAVEFLTRAIRLDPSRESSYLALARMHEQSGEYASAIDVLEKGRKDLPESKDLAVALGANLARGGRYEEAASLLKRVLERHPGEHDAYVSLSLAYRGLNQRDQELRVLEDLAANRPDYPMIHVLLAQSRLTLHPVEHERVLQDLERAQQADPNDPEIYALRGRVYLEMKRYGEAAEALQRAVEGWPASSETRYLLGRAYHFLGDEQRAKEEFARVEHLKRLEAAAAAQR